MSKPNKVELSTPPGRFVFGDLYDPETENFDGEPLTFKKGADAGKARVEYIVGLAIPKTQAHWGNEPGWGQTIWATGHAAFPGGEAQQPGFSWKIYDGDQKTLPPKSKSKVPYCDREGWAGCWVLRFGSSFAPDIYDAVTNPDNPPPLTQANAVLSGHVIQVVGTVSGNTGKSPGVYLNLGAIGLRSVHLPLIKKSGIDVKGKFGGTVAGASALPPAVQMPAAAPQAAPASPPPPAAPVAAAPPPAAAAPPTAVVPAPAMLGVPPMAAAPPPPAPAAAAPPPPAAKPPHKGIPYASYKAQGWTDAQLAADGYVG
jgi:hypothetical protein